MARKKRPCQEGNVEDSRKAKRGCETYSWGTRERVPFTRCTTQTQTLTPNPPSWSEYINIGSRQDELDPTIFKKLSTSVAIVAAPVHKYWTSAFAKAGDNTKLMKLLKLAKMYTSRSHVLNCELYKVLVMKVDELRSTVGGARISTRCVQITRPFMHNSPFPKMRGHGLYTT
ncbi:hypothetical protein Fot_07132 [Forsythia ovata]|uniref:Uncharacterized protein n=1 Tax=Forsythia ovata TaxID=205694 RepID=A0ABD1WUY4_9LAMI